MLRGFLVVVVLGTLGCKPVLDGGWGGTAACSNDTFPISALFNENGAGEVDGVVYIEQIFGAFVVRGDVDDGLFDPDDGLYKMDLQTDEDPEREFAIEMFYGKTPDDLEGEVDVFNDNGESTDTCELELERVDVND